MYKIINGNDFAFTGRYNGKDFKFPIGKPVMCPPDAAVHIFGLGESDKAMIYSRHGWAIPPKGTMEDGKKILDNFTFEWIEMTLDAPLAETEHESPVLQAAGDEDQVPDGAKLTLPASRGAKKGAAKSVHARFAAA